jgi:ribonuclease HII
MAMERAVTRLGVICDYLLLDAIRIGIALPQKPLIGGDGLCFSIAAASILAKTARDRALVRWDAVFPQYGFARNKGYGTRDHLDALERVGPTALHRFSFEPVRNASRHPVWTGYPAAASTSSQGELFACL